MSTAEPYVYLLEASLGFIKIGNSVDPQKRLRTFNACSPCPVRLIAQWHGPRDEEQELHHRFVQQRRHNEWFALEGDLASFVEGVRGRGLDRISDWLEIDFQGAADRRRAGRIKAAEKLRDLWANTDHRERVKAYKVTRDRWAAQERRKSA